MNVRKIALLSIFSALAIGVSALEGLIPHFLPGVKLGLANIFVLVLLCEFSIFEAIIVNLIRVVIGALISGTIVNLMGFLMSFIGAFLSLIVMWAILKLFKKFTLIGVSVFGSVFHILGQMIIAFIFLGNEILYYFPIILIASVITGVVVGEASSLIVNSKIISNLKDRYNL